MVRVKRGTSVKRKHNKLKSLTKGFRGRGSTTYKAGLQRWQKSMIYQYSDRKRFRREVSSLWIERINSSCRLYNVSYSKMMSNLSGNNIWINNKMLFNLSLYEPLAFRALAKI